MLLVELLMGAEVCEEPAMLADDTVIDVVDGAVL